jgi:predicted TIM-barrel fold metal-dependent hydrolase
MINLSEYPVLDHHCHAFLPEKEDEKGISFAQFFHWTKAPEEENENLILYRKIITELARVLSCRSKKPADVILERSKAYTYGNREKQIEYITKLFDDAKISWLFFDTGYPSAEYPGSYDADPQKLGETFLKQKFNFILRFEKLIWTLFKKSLPFEEMLNTYLDTLTNAVKREGYIGFKSAIAYGYGLDIRDRDIGEAKKVYEELRDKNLLIMPLEEKMIKYPEIINKEKVIRDFLTCRGIEKSIELNVPIQVHTGIGESPIINAQKCNPLFLYDLLRDPNLGKAKFVLLHAGYPYGEEFAWLANSFPNVYLDLSCTIPWIHFGIRQRILEILEMAPLNKIMYGSDGGKIPETIWIAAILGKEGISKALQNLVDSEFIDEDYAYRVAGWILSENAKKLYHIE